MHQEHYFLIINHLSWSKELLKLFGLNLKILPEVKRVLQYLDTQILNQIFKISIPISGVIGDSQASIFANQCFNKG